MQKLIFITSIFIFSISFGQKVDTLAHLKKIETNKAKYIGKPFSILLKDLKNIQPKTVWSSIGQYKYLVSKSRFEFTKEDINFFGENTILSIQWQKKISRDSADYYSKKNNYHFTKDEKDFYADKIVGDITVYKNNH